MPTSTWRSISPILEIILDLDPRPTRVLDVGIGTGKYGFLLREYLRYWDDHLHRQDAHLQIDGIEVFPDYITDLQRQIYDQILIGNAADILPQLPDNAYDLILLLDIIEHFEQTAGEHLLRECQRVASVVIVSTPPVFVHQPGKWDNPNEEHLSLWPKRAFASLGAVWVFDAENRIAIFAQAAYRSQLRPLFRLARTWYFRLPPFIRLHLRAEAPYLAPIYRWLAGAR